jgi:hypothetical protein
MIYGKRDALSIILSLGGLLLNWVRQKKRTQHIWIIKTKSTLKSEKDTYITPFTIRKLVPRSFNLSLFVPQDQPPPEFLTPSTVG